MLPPALRLRRSEDFALTIRRGIRVGRDSVVVHARQVTDSTDCRVGFVVSRAVGGAVVRNRVRRRLRGVVVEHRDELPRGVDVVVRALPGAADAEYAALDRDVTGALGAAARRLTRSVEDRS